MALELIVFDCDGVLLESMDAKTQAFYRIGLEFGTEAAERLLMFHSLHFGVSRLEKFTWLYREVLGQEITQAELQRLNEQFVKLCFDEIRTCRLVPGVEDVLHTWHKRLPLYVASGAPHDELHVILRERKLAQYFEGIYGSPPHKNTVLQNILQETGKNPDATVMIGDGMTDLRAAEFVGCLFYGRGDVFKETKYPWHQDLTCLNTWLEEQKTLL